MTLAVTGLGTACWRDGLPSSRFWLREPALLGRRDLRESRLEARRERRERREPWEFLERDEELDEDDDETDSARCLVLDGEAESPRARSSRSRGSEWRWRPGVAPSVCDFLTGFVFLCLGMMKRGAHAKSVVQGELSETAADMLAPPHVRLRQKTLGAHTEA